MSLFDLSKQYTNYHLYVVRMGVLLRVTTCYHGYSCHLLPDLMREELLKMAASMLSGGFNLSGLHQFSNNWLNTCSKKLML